MTNSEFTEDTKAIYLLCGFSQKNRKEEGNELKSLTLGEYNKLAKWLMVNKKRPADLFDETTLEKAASAVELEHSRLERLINRGIRLANELTSLGKSGIWVLSRSDIDYPVRIKRHLKERSPAILYGIGNRDLLKKGGLCVVGSRNADAKALAFTSDTAKACAHNNIQVVSGAAKGIDEASMRAALEAGGTAIGVLAYNLINTAGNETWRRHIQDGRLLFLSSRHPDAGYANYALMERNKYIYSLADYALVVSSSFNKGGTWAGATEELRRENAIPVFVRINEDVQKDVRKGNLGLIAKGGIQWPGTPDPAVLMQANSKATESSPTADLFSDPIPDADEEIPEGKTPLEKTPADSQERAAALVDEAADSLLGTTVAPSEPPSSDVLTKENASETTAPCIVPAPEDVAGVEEVPDGKAGDSEAPGNVVQRPSQQEDTSELAASEDDETTLPTTTSGEGPAQGDDCVAKKATVVLQTDTKTDSNDEQEKLESASGNEPASPEEKQDKSKLLYSLVIPIVITEMESPVTDAELAEKFNVNKTQMRAWLQEAVDEGLVEKLSRPVRYQKMDQKSQGSLF